HSKRCRGKRVGRDDDVLAPYAESAQGNLQCSRSATNSHRERNLVRDGKGFFKRASVGAERQSTAGERLGDQAANLGSVLLGEHNSRCRYVHLILLGGAEC